MKINSTKKVHELIRPICEDELIRNDNEIKRLRRVNTREICPRVGQVSIQKEEKK